MSKPYRQGRHTVICQQTGFEFYDDEVVRQWDGLIVGKKFADYQHPQELRRSRPERAVQAPLNPEPPDTFVDTFLDFIIVEDAPESEISLLMWEDNSLIGWG